MQTLAFAGSLPWIGLLNQNAATAADQDQVRIGMIGAGSRGTKLLLHLQTIPEVKLVAVCDDYGPHLYEAKRLTKGAAPDFPDYRALLQQPDIDAVIIATPPGLHREITCAALQAGKHVFCEKIMALSIADCREMLRVQQQTGRILQIGFQRLFDIRYLKAFEVIRQGGIGALTCMKTNWHRNDDWRRPVKEPGQERRINWRLYQELSGGMMAELAAHQIVTSNWIMGEHPTSVTGFGSINFWQDGRETHDNVSAIFSYPDGVLLSQTCILSNQHYGVLEQIMGSTGTIELEAGRLFLESPPPSPGIYQLLQSIENKLFETVPIGGASWIVNDANRDKAEYLVDDLHIPSPTQLELEAFVASARSGQPQPELLRESYHASVSAILANEAMRTGTIVNWPEEAEI